MKTQWLIAAATMFVGLAVARADVVVTIGPALVTAPAGSTDNAVDVLLTNDGSSAVSVDSLSFELSTSTPEIDFTNATTATALATYIFSGDSLFGPDIATSTGQSLLASDVAVTPVTVNPGAEVGLGHVLFDVAPGAAPGTFPVVLVPVATSFSDVSGNTIPISSLVNGEIDIPGIATVPEPSYSLILVGALMAVVAYKRRSRKRFDVNL